MRYRDGEYPGEFAVTTRDGKRHALPFFELVDEFKRFKTHRCLACGDWWSGLADVSISDGDPNIYASSQTGARPPRQSMTMARTAAGREILRVAEELGLIESRPAAFQPETNLGLQRKRFRYAAFVKATPQRAPTAPVAYDEPDALLSDAEVISRMANHRPVADEDRRAAPAETAIRISLDESRRDDVVFRPRGDKSISQRAMFAAALAQGTSSVRNVPASDDLQCNLAVLRQLGVDVWEAADSSYVVAGRGLRGLAAPAAGQRSTSETRPPPRAFSSVCSLAAPENSGSTAMRSCAAVRWIGGRPARARGRRHRLCRRARPTAVAHPRRAVDGDLP